MSAQQSGQCTDEAYRWALSLDKEEDESPWVGKGHVLEWTLSETANDAAYRAKMRKARAFFLGGQGGSFKSVAGVQIAYRLFDQDGASEACLIMTGWNENILKYKELIFDLHNRGFSVFIMDHHAQGLSGRLVDKCANEQLSFIVNFDDYVSDALHFAREVVRPRLSGRRLGVYAHSMGGLVVTHAALRERAEDTPPEERLFTRLALSAPFFGLNSSMPDFFILGLACFLTLIGKAATHAPGDTNDDPLLPKPSTTHCSHHAGRTWHTQRIRELVPQVLTCSPSVAWIRHCICAHLRLFQQCHTLGGGGGSSGGSVGSGDDEEGAMSILLLQAEHDVLVANEAQDIFTSLVNGGASKGAGGGIDVGRLTGGRGGPVRVVMIEGAFHEILNETDDIRDPALELIVQHLLQAERGAVQEEEASSGSDEGSSGPLRGEAGRKKRTFARKKQDKGQGSGLPETHPSSLLGIVRSVLQWCRSCLSAAWGGWKWLRLPPMVVLLLVLALLLLLLLGERWSW
jgi:lysophospholipase